MMLGDQFMASQGEPIAVGERLVSMSYVVEISDAVEISMRIEHDDRAFRRSVHISSDGAPIEINGVGSKKMVMWTDTMPDDFVMQINADKQRSRLRIWNGWLDENGVEQAWIGNAGIVVESREDEFVLRCSDGFSEPDFNRFVIRGSVRKCP